MDSYSIITKELEDDSDTESVCSSATDTGIVRDKQECKVIDDPYVTMDILEFNKNIVTDVDEYPINTEIEEKDNIPLKIQFISQINHFKNKTRKYNVKQ